MKCTINITTKFNYLIIVPLLFLFFNFWVALFPGEVWAINCDGTTGDSVRFTLIEPNSCTGGVTVTITQVNGPPGGNMQIFEESVGKLGNIVAEVGRSASGLGSGAFSTDGTYVVFLADPNDNACPVRESFTVSGCTTPTNTPTPPAGCVALGDACDIDNDLCCDPNVCADLGGVAIRCAEPTPTPIGGVPTIPPEPTTPPYDPCASICKLADPSDPLNSTCEDSSFNASLGDCRGCVADGDGAYTALGCIPTSPGPFAVRIVEILFGIAGGIAFLLMLYGAFLCITSKGDPQRAQACKETITSALIGLLMLIFSLMIIGIIFSPDGGILKNIVPSNLF